MTLTFIGHGYVGLVTAAVFADLGNTVWVIGHTPEKIENLKKGIIPIYEPGLEEIVKRNVAAGRLLFTLEYPEAISQSDVVFIAVGTPSLPDGQADLSVVFAVAKELAPHLKDYAVVVTKSTVPVGTNKQVKEIVAKYKQGDSTFDVASAPEFLREGQAISDTLHPDRVVIGTESENARDLLVELHKPLFAESSIKESNLVTTNIETAELIKYAANAFLATKISFANAVAQLAETVGADGPDVLEAIGLDKRIGPAFLYAGAGYGGSCFPKDVKALITMAKQYNYNFMMLLKDVEQVNEDAMIGIVKKAQRLLGENLAGKTVGILGLSFKPDTDDMRYAPSITIIRQLIQLGATIKAYDPIALENAKRIFAQDQGITFVENAYAAAEGADLLIVVTEWNEFKELDLAKVQKLLKQPFLIDARNIYNPEQLKALEFTYFGVGR